LILHPTIPTVSKFLIARPSETKSRPCLASIWQAWIQDWMYVHDLWN
jgi:hypothetical protein